MRWQDPVPFRSACLAAAAGMMVLLCGACSSHKSASEMADEEAVSQEQRKGLDKFMVDTKDPTVVTYGEDGTVTGGRRSQYEGKGQVAYGGNWDGKNYEKKQYDKTWWGGKKKEATKAYSGNQDGSRFQVESLMMGKTASQAAQRSAYDGKGSPVKAYNTGAATETGVGDVQRTLDPRTEGRGTSFPPPRITGYKQQQRMEIEETRQLLGRD